MWFFFEGRPKPCKGWRDGRKLNLISLSWVPKPSSHCDYFTGQTMLVEPLNISRLGTPFAQLFPERRSCIWTLCRLQSFFVFFIWLLFSVDCLLFFFFFSSSPLSPAITGCARLTAHPEFVFFFPFTTITKVLPIKEFLATLYILWVFPANLDFPPKSFWPSPKEKSSAL